MAIKYEALKHKLTTDSLSPTENAAIGIVEKHIDMEILDRYEHSISGEIYISLSIANFEIDPATGKRTSFGNIRKTLMAKELRKRFENAGWAIELRLDDGREGKMSGPDYMILKGKS